MVYALLGAIAAAGGTIAVLRKRGAAASGPALPPADIPLFCPSPYKIYGPARTEASNESLLVRIGGEGAVDLACKMLYDRLYTDTRISHWFDGIPMAVQARKLAGFVKFAMGGKVSWTGKDLMGAHEHLVHKGLNDKDFDAVLDNFGKVLTELNVPGPLLAEAAALVESTRDAVLGRAGKPTMETNFKTTPEIAAKVAAERAEGAAPIDAAALKVVKDEHKNVSRMHMPDANKIVVDAKSEKLDEAEEKLRLGLSSMTWTHGPMHVETAKVMEALADVLTRKGNASEAVQYLESTIEAKKAAASTAEAKQEVVAVMRKLAALHATLGHDEQLQQVSKAITAAA